MLSQLIVEKIEKENFGIRSFIINLSMKRYLFTQILFRARSFTYSTPFKCIQRVLLFFSFINLFFLCSVAHLCAHYLLHTYANYVYSRNLYALNDKNRAKVSNHLKKIHASHCKRKNCNF